MLSELQSHMARVVLPTYRCTLCCVTAEIDPIYQHLVGAKHRTKYDILVHTFPDSEEEISARKFPIPTDSMLETLIQSDSEYESVMPQTQLEKEVVDCNLLR